MSGSRKNEEGRISAMESGIEAFELRPPTVWAVTLTKDTVEDVVRMLREGGYRNVLVSLPGYPWQHRLQIQADPPGDEQATQTWLEDTVFYRAQSPDGVSLRSVQTLNQAEFIARYRKRLG